MATDDLSRRSLLHAILTTLGAAALPISWAEMARASPVAHGDAYQGVGAGLSFLNDAQAADVDAVAAQIIPTDDTPGAREAGVVHFIDQALATFLSPIAADYRTQLAEFQVTFRERHPAATSFATLQSEDQIAYLKTVERTQFFDATRLLTLLGMFTMPAYGGNRNGAGWKLIGFEDRHAFRPPFGYYDRDYQGMVVDSAKEP
jgi:gluconate 2-dehydrogenase gamma chain